MALQGTIDAFPLADVLALLSASSKTGRLVLSGDRGRVALFIESGDVVGVECDELIGERAELALLEMLRFAEGEFEFHNDLDPSALLQELPAAGLGTCLVQAQELLERWVEVEAVVPSPLHRFALVRELPGDSIEIDSSTWRILSLAGHSVSDASQHLEMDEFTTTSVVAQLVGSGLLEILEPADAAEDAADLSVLDSLGGIEPHESPRSVGEPGPMQTVPEDPGSSEFPEHFPIDDLIGTSDESPEDDPWSSPEMEQLEAQRFAAAQTFEPVEVEPLPMIDLEPVDDAFRGGPADEAVAGVGLVGEEAPVADETTDEVLRQMSRLSPKAAEAIAAALNSVPGQPGEQPDDGEGGRPFGGTF